MSSTTSIIPSRSSYPVEIGLVILLLCLILPSLILFVLIARQDLVTDEAKLNDEFHRIVLDAYPQARCMDESVASYYLRFASSKSDERWLIYFEGGWFCYSIDSCRSRRQYSPRFVTSHASTLTNQSLTGIFASFKQFNLIYVPYCSSDLWTGSSNSTHSHGHDIFHAIFHHQNYFPHAKQLVFVGFSAGGLGLLLNLPPILPKFSSQTDLRLMLDSAWFIDYPGLSNGIAKINQGMIYWNSQLPATCQLEPRYRCLFGSEAIRMFPSSIRIFILQSLFDLTQLYLDHVHLDGVDFSSKLLTNLDQSSSRLAIFAPACSLHGFLFRSSWSKFEIEQRTLASVLYRWLKRNNRYHPRLIDEHFRSSSCPHEDFDHDLHIS